MNTTKITTDKKKSIIKWLAIVILLALVFTFLYRHGVSPVWAAVAIVCLKGVFKFIYVIASCLVTLAIIIGILSFLIF